MKLRYLVTAAVTALSMSAISSVLADDSKSYTEGAVAEVTSFARSPACSTRT